MGARREVARRAEVCVLPNERRVEIFKKQTGTDRPVEVVWNVPSLEEIVSTRPKPKPNEPLALFYGGTLTPKILPQKLLQGIEDQKLITMHICGYPTYSEEKYYTWLKELASKNKNIILYGPVSRYKMWSIADQCHASICLYSPQEAQLNFRHIVGAANKPFDAMARGLAVVVSDLPDWTEIYLEEHTKEAGNGRREAGRELGICPSKEVFRIPSPGKGFGIAINPENRESIRAGLEWMLANREKLWEMGERGRSQIKNKWNYFKESNRVFSHL